MKFSDIVKEASTLVEESGRITYRALQREFALDEETLEDLKAELLYSRPQIVDDEGRGLIWQEEAEKRSPLQPQPRTPSPQSPSSYTPQHLAERIRAEQQAMESRGAADGERKTITALFADLKGSTALIEGLDPEEARAIIDPALQLMMDAVHRYEGYVAQALGDGIFALFGAPIAHEDHPQRALYAALRMQEEMRSYSDQSRLKGGPPLQMRVGINTGEVVVRSIRKDDLHTDYVPVGHSTNLAARMEQIATPGSIVVSEYTRKLTEGYFELKALGAAGIKGVDEPLNVYEVMGAGALRTRFQVTTRRGLTRFVGRHSEMEQLQRAFVQTQAGHGQIVGVMGDPGLGKSRLFYEFKLTAQSQCLVLEAFAVSHGKASPYLPLVELLKTYFQIEPHDDERTRKEKVTGKVLILDRSLEDTLPYLFSLLGVEDPDSSLQQMDAQIRRRRTFEALARLLVRESRNQPVALIVEDLHWIDAETQGVLDALSAYLTNSPILLLVNYRPEYQHDWSRQTYTQVRLSPLGKAEAEELLTFLLGTDASLPPLKQLILDKTEGTPFFMEEVVQTLAEEAALAGQRGKYRLERAATELRISATVQGVLAARIDRLEPGEKTLLQQLSVIGRQFPRSLIELVVSQAEAEVYRLLASLQEKEFLFEQPAFPEVEYVFKHALTQDVAYGTVLQEQRKTLHERTGQAIETLYKDGLDEQYTTLAHHYQLSGNIKKAVEYLGRAGQQAVQRSANAEAIQYLTSALDLLQALPDSPARSQHELTLQVALGVPLSATKGYSTPEVGKVYLRARELCEQGGDTPELFPTLWGLWAFYVVRAEYQTARELSEELWRLAQASQDSAQGVEAHYTMGFTLDHFGEFPQARVHLEQGSELYDPQQHGSLAFVYGSFDPGVGCYGYAALALWHLGYPEQALQKSHEAVALAQELSQPFGLALALVCAAMLRQSRREAQAAQEQAEAAIALSTEQGFPLFLAWATILRGWAVAMQRQAEDGISEIREGLAAWQAVGAEFSRTHFWTLLAQAHGQAGQGEEGLQVVGEALEIAIGTGEGFYEAELHRMKGQLTLQAGNPQEATQCFHKAIEIACQQAAKSWELRAATSLARLWRGQGKITEAHDLLAPVYNWFIEGFDTADLKDAKAMLEELG